MARRTRQDWPGWPALPTRASIGSSKRPRNAPCEYIFIEIDWDCVLSGYRFMEPRRDPDAGQSPDWGDSLDDLIALAARRKRVAYFCECWAAPTNSVSTSRRYW
jgi:hypothetical protein